MIEEREMLCQIFHWEGREGMLEWMLGDLLRVKERDGEVGKLIAIVRKI